MKKTLALLLAIVISAVAICTLTFSAFAENETPAPDAGAADTADKNEAADADKNEAADADKEEDKKDEENKEEEKETQPETLPGVQLPDGLKPTDPTKAPETEATEATKAPEVNATEATKAPETSLAGTDVVTNPEGVTSIDDGPTTTKKPAAVDNDIPDTGSNIVVPAVALLVLAAGTVAVVKTKKD